MTKLIIIYIIYLFGNSDARSVRQIINLFMTIDETSSKVSLHAKNNKKLMQLDIITSLE